MWRITRTKAGRYVLEINSIYSSAVLAYNGNEPELVTFIENIGIEQLQALHGLLWPVLMEHDMTKPAKDSPHER